MQAIRPCRESKTGWPPAPGDGSRRNHSSSQLNEHGPALKVFWTRKSELGARGFVAESCELVAAGETKSCTAVKLTNTDGADLTQSGAMGIRTVEQNNGPEGTGHGLVPLQFLSVRWWTNWSHLPPGARTRWVTERIASLSNGSVGKGPESRDEITGSSSGLSSAPRQQRLAR